MGKRKAAKKPQAKRKREPLATVFACLFCNHEKSCEVKMDKKEMKGVLTCKVCGQTNVMDINYLSAPVDIYADWVDKCDEAARLDREEQLAGSSFRPSTNAPAARTRATEVARRREEEEVEPEAEDLDAEGEDEDLGGGGGGGGYAGEGIVADDDDDY